MAFRLMEERGTPSYGVVSYIVDNESDIANLSTDHQPGSTALVASTSSVYVLNNQLEWILLETEGGGGSELPIVTVSDNGKVLKVIEGEWNKGDVPTELPEVTSSDDGYQLTVLNGKWNKENLIAKREATVTLSNATNSMDFSLGSAGNMIPVGIQVSDSSTQTKLSNINFTTEMVFNLVPYPNNYVRLTAPEGSTFQAGTYKIFIIFINPNNLAVR